MDSAQISPASALQGFADEVKQLCEDFSSRDGSVYILDVKASIDRLVELHSAVPATQASAPLGMTQIPVATLGKIHDRIAELERDAARMDWLDARRGTRIDCYIKDGKFTYILYLPWGAPIANGSSVRAAIDAAIGAKP